MILLVGCVQVADCTFHPDTHLMSPLLITYITRFGPLSAVAHRTTRRQRLMCLGSASVKHVSPHMRRLSLNLKGVKSDRHDILTTVFFSVDCGCFCKQRIMWVLDVYVDVQFQCTCSGFDKHKMDSTSMWNLPTLSLLDFTMDLSLAELAIIGGLFVLSLQFVYFAKGKRD